MRMSAAALGLGVMLGVHLVAPTTTPAGGRRHVSPGLHAGDGAPVRGARPVAPGPPTGAFGSPGGFPFPDSAARYGSAGGPRRGLATKVPRHRPVAWFTPPALLYTPGVPYGLGMDTAPAVVTVSPVIHASTAVYVSQPVLVQTSSAPDVAPPETSGPRVVEHATGRYELRGDGTSTPHAWVWVPHPPPAPPDAQLSAEPPSRELARPVDRTPTYRWTDGDGTLFVTNRLERVPEPHRAQARGPAP